LDADFESSFLLEIMAWKFNRMADVFEKYGDHIGSKRDARRTRICAVLCSRMANDSVYYDNAAKAFPYGSKAWSNEITAVEKQDMEMLGKLIGRHITHWWD
jgi:hypothetical protein